MFVYILFTFQSIHSEGSHLRVKMANGNVMKIPISEESPNEINITEELTRTSVWKSLSGTNTESSPKKRHKKSNKIAPTESEQINEIEDENVIIF